MGNSIYYDGRKEIWIRNYQILQNEKNECYFFIVNLYSFYLKYIVIIDVLAIASGFVLRAVAGVVIVGTHILPWLIVCTILLALFLALNKRRHEISILKDEAGLHRKDLKEYSISYLDQMITIVTAGTIVAYSLYTLNSENIYLMFTIPFVIYGIFRYLYLIHRYNRGGKPEVVLLEDKPLLINIGLWGILSAFFIYIRRGLTKQILKSLCGGVAYRNSFSLEIKRFQEGETRWN